MRADTVAAILGGGAGLRIGGRKALVLLDQKPLVKHVAGAFRPTCKAIAVVGDRDAAGVIGAASLTDPPGFPRGPLTGVFAALEWAVSENAHFVIVAPCDTPLLTADVVMELAEGMSAGVDVVCAETSDGLQPLVAIWRSNLAKWLGAELAVNHPPVHELLARARVKRVRFDNPHTFMNVNTLEDLQRAEAILKAPR